MRKDFEVARELHSQLYDLLDVDVDALDKLENDLINDVYGIEETVEEYMLCISKTTGEISGKTDNPSIIKGKTSQKPYRAIQDMNFPKPLKHHRTCQRRKLVHLHYNKTKLKKFLWLQAVLVLEKHQWVRLPLILE